MLQKDSQSNTADAYKVQEDDQPAAAVNILWMLCLVAFDTLGAFLFPARYTFAQVDWSVGTTSCDACFRGQPLIHILIYSHTFVLLASLLALGVRLRVVPLIIFCIPILSAPVLLLSNIHIPHPIIVLHKVSCEVHASLSAGAVPRPS